MLTLTRKLGQSLELELSGLATMVASTAASKARCGESDADIAESIKHLLPSLTVKLSKVRGTSASISIQAPQSVAVRRSEIERVEQ